MIFIIAKWTILSLVLIMLVHHLYDFFQGTLTIPKTRDLVNRPAARYEEMLSTIKVKKPASRSAPKDTGREDMKGELAAFLQDLKKTSTAPQVVPANMGLSTGATSF
tara:strand:+ start:7853 stop:8173 length:321 start_codon:yes stop_codon:yes gene_type:complete